VKPIVMPAFGVAMTEGLLLNWLKSAGDPVDEGEPIMEIETDKSTVEVESPAAGTVGPLLFEPGAVVPVGVEMTHILEAGDDPTGSTDVPAAASTGLGEPGPGPAAVTSAADGAGAEPEPAATEGGSVPGPRTPNRLSPRERRLARERELAQRAGDNAEILDEEVTPE
jgi:pyruvate dehydrogenase E2 component (dihydrolipoamide acetyltransferase)